MKNLLIIGARGWGREVYGLAKWLSDTRHEFAVKGFLDEKSDALAGMAGYPPIISSVEDYVPGPDDVFFSALGQPFYRKKYADIIAARGGEFISLVDPRAIVGLNTRIGKGCFIGAYACVSCDIRIGDHTVVQGFATLGHDVRVGDYCQIGTSAFMGGYAVLEDMVTLFPGAHVNPHIAVGAGATVGACSVAIRRVKPGTTVYGNPARILEY